MPEGLQAGVHDLAEFKLSRKRYLAHGIVGVATASGVAVGAAPTSFSDALLLAPLEVAEINAIAKVYGIKNDDKSKQLFDSIVDVGTVSVVAKAAISGLKNIPGINIGASVLNAVIAGSIVASLGEGSTYIFEQIYLGNKTYDDIDWVTKILEDKLTIEFIESVKAIIKDLGDNVKLEDVAKIIM